MVSSGGQSLFWGEMSPEVQELLSYKIVLHTGWTERRVESWEYVDDSRWRRHIALHVVNGELLDYVNEAFSDVNAGRVTNNIKIDDYDAVVLNLPLLELDKGTQIAEFEVSDGKGCPVQLFLRENAVQVSLTALSGAMRVEHGEESDCPLEPLREKVELSRLLSSIFSEPLPPVRSDGTIMRMEDPRIYDDISSYIEDSYCFDNAGDWKSEDIETALRDFRQYWVCSPVFRFFTVVYTLRWVAYAKIDLKGNIYERITCDLLVTKNIVKKTESKWDSVKNTLKGNLPLSFELDGLGTADKNRVVIASPKGTYFTPCYPMQYEIDLEKSKFYVYRSLLEPYKGKDSLTEAEGFGSLTPGHAAVEVHKTFYEVPDQNKKHTVTYQSLYRRIPIGESTAGIYNLNLSLVPRLGLRMLGYMLFLAFSALAFLMWVSNKSGNENAFSLATLLAIASIAVVVVANREDEPFVRRATLKLPRILCAACVTVDVIGFLFLVFIKSDQIAIIACILCFLLAVVCLVWIIWSVYRKYRWSHCDDAYEVFALPIYVEKLF